MEKTDQNLTNTQTLQQIEAFVKAFNEASLYSDIQVIEQSLHEEVVFVYGNFSGEMKGKEACLKSIEEYWEMGKTLSYEMKELKYWQWNDLVQLKFDYEVSYQMEETAHREKGTEVWTVKQVGGGWKLLWRGLIYNEAI